MGKKIRKTEAKMEIPMVLRLKMCISKQGETLSISAPFQKAS